LRHTFATRLSAGGVANHMVTQMLRQSDAEVFKLYSQAKLGMMREALAKLDRQATERTGQLVHGAARLTHFVHSFCHNRAEIGGAGKEETL
jgi:hypothetical protein